MAALVVRRRRRPVLVVRAVPAVIPDCSRCSVAVALAVMAGIAGPRPVPVVLVVSAVVRGYSR
jgi:hypothetical protein